METGVHRMRITARRLRRRPSPPAERSAPAKGSAETAATVRSASTRLTSLDAFRGFTILAMLLVNNVALDTATPRQLQHAPWNGGIHFADLVFPWFLLIVGVALPWSVASQRRQGVRGWRLAGRVLERTFWLVLLGCLVDSSVARHPYLGLGVLQIIGLAFAVGSLGYGLKAPWRAAFAALLLFAHWAALRFIPIPGAGAGLFTEEQNLIRYLNEQHLQAYGLKGVISAIPTGAMVLIGTLAGDWLRREGTAPLRKGLGLAGAGVLLMGAGWLWSLDLPFNKPVWTASYILAGAGTGLSVLAIIYLVLDVARLSFLGLPFAVPGSNAIAAYVAPILVKVFILQVWTVPGADGQQVTLQKFLLGAAVARWGAVGGGWAYTLGYLAFWWLVLLWMYRRKLFLKV